MAKLKLNNVEVITESGGTATLTSALNPEGTVIKSTGETGGTKFLREDGDGTSSWVAIEPGAPSITDNGDATAITIASDESVTLSGTLAVTNPTSLTSLKPTGNHNLSGTYTDHEMIMGDKFTLTGDLTINDNLVLASLSGSGQDITITDDGNGRTITTAGKVLSCTTTNTDATVTTASTADLRAGTGVTGTGVPAGATIASVTNATTFELSAAATASGTVNLTFDTGVFEAGEFLGTAGLPSLTDLSGTLQSGAAIGSGVTFPAGHILQVQLGEQNQETVVTGSWTVVGLAVQITPRATTNKILITAHCNMQFNNNGIGVRIKRGSTVIRTTTSYANYTSSGGQINMRSSYSVMDSPSTTSPITYSIEAQAYGGSQTFNEAANYSEIIAMEVVA